MSAQKFEDLYIFQQSRELVKLVYQASSKWSDKGLQDQVRRAAVSVLSNIAEGFERGTKKEFLHFLYIARGSCGEVRAQLYVALDQKYVTEKDFNRTQDKADYVSRLLAKFIKGYKKKGHRGQKYQSPTHQDQIDFRKELQRIVDQGK